MIIDSHWRLAGDSDSDGSIMIMMMPVTRMIITGLA
jgi:hypothetical protein